MNNETYLPMTLAQSLIAEGLIRNPEFIKAAELQAELLKQGSFKLLGVILAEMQEQKGLTARQRDGSGLLMAS